MTENFSAIGDGHEYMNNSENNKLKSFFYNWNWENT